MRKVLFVLLSFFLVAAGLFVGEKTVYFPDQENCELGAYESCSRLAFLYRELDEPSLFGKQDGSKNYRFYWSRSFHRQVIIRIDVDPVGNSSMSVKVFDNSRAVNLVETMEVSLSAEQLIDIEKRAFKVRTWLESPNTPERSGGMDGASWCFEIATEDQFNAGCRWSPQAMPPIPITERNRHIVPDWRRVDADFHALGVALIEFSGMDFGEIY